MLAVRRKVRAIGRIKFLRISTITIKLISPTGVPVGIKCDKNFFIDLTHLNIIQDNHNE